MLRAADIRGMYAIIPTPALPGANNYGAERTINLVETERLINALIKDGVDGLITTGTTGEIATITDDEYRDFVDCVLSVVNKRIPTFIGASGLGAHQAVARLKFASEKGADGSLLGLPMWQPLTLDMAVDYYRQVSKLFPKLSLMVYPNVRAFRFGFPLEFWGAVSKSAPTVVAAKASRAAGLKELIEATEGRVNFVPIDMQVQEFHAISPETTTACWSTGASMGPEPCVAIMKALSSGNSELVKSIAKDIAWANEPIAPILTNLEFFASHNIQMEKLRIGAAGYCTPGPIRPPYDHMPEEFSKASQECGKRWAQITPKYR